MTDASANVIDAFRLDRLHAVITGASRGLGKGCALALAGAGARVTLVGRTETDLDAVAAEIKGTGGEAETLVADVTDIETFSSKLNTTPSIDIFVNNAGTNKPQPFLSVDAETFDALMDVNLRGAF
ncbi:MAG: SDR family NAD(P)-dependent oxidoreductase, partial [Alphaproteobacteria bacterium]